MKSQDFLIFQFCEHFFCDARFDFKPISYFILTNGFFIQFMKPNNNSTANACFLKIQISLSILNIIKRTFLKNTYIKLTLGQTYMSFICRRTFIFQLKYFILLIKNEFKFKSNENLQRILRI